MRRGLVHRIAQFRHELAAADRITADRRSAQTYRRDLVRYRAMRFAPAAGRNAVRHIRLADGPEVTYRLNRGDLESLREIWVDEIYRLPAGAAPVRVVVDAGANIGLTSQFFAHRYGAGHVVAVEPVGELVPLIERNLAQTAATSTVIEAAVGDRDGDAHFADHGSSNRGRVSPTGRPVRMVSMATVLDRTPDGRADLVKMDIEGGEAALLGGDTRWLGRIDRLLIEFHPTLVDMAALVRVLVDAGFHHWPPGSYHPKSTDYFVRRAD